MNDHARSIYQAALDGKTVQRHFTPLESEWNDRDPFQVLPSYSPREIPNCWRIKSKSKIFHFRIYFSNTYKRPHLFSERDFLISSHDFEKDVGFGGWISEWMSHEVEVEQ